MYDYRRIGTGFGTGSCKNKLVWNLFSGGHVEPGKSFTLSVTREIYEETGLTIEAPVPCGIKQLMEAGVHSIVLFYQSNRYSGTLRASEEGFVFWLFLNELKNHLLANDFGQTLSAFCLISRRSYFTRKQMNSHGRYTGGDATMKPSEWFCWILLVTVLIAGGIFFWLKPDLVWRITERWKSYRADEPSDFYRFSAKFGGICMIIAGFFLLILPFVLK